MSKRLLPLPLIVALVVVAGCGSPSHTVPVNKPLPPSVKQACPPARHLEGSMGACSPEQQAPASATVTGVAAPIANFVPAGSFPDFSNNDPCICAGVLRAHGHPGEIDKVNQGVGFVDRTFGAMAADAKAHGLCIGGYDFDQDYTAAEAYTFVAGLQRAHIGRSSRCTFPPTLDVEFGLPSTAGLEHQLAVLHRAYGRALIYTGEWYWGPHFGCWLPKGVREGWLKFWLSGYPVAPILCGLPGHAYEAHQFTDHGFNGAGYADLSVYRGGSFRGFTQQGSTPAATHAAKVRSLHDHERDRATLHTLIDRHHCRRGQHVTPREPLSTRRHYHNKLCPRWLTKGQRDIAVISRYRREGIR